MTNLLDRLIEYPPDRSIEPSRELHLSVRRDLENLLNTRRRCLSFPDDLTELQTSLVDYGISDFMGSELGNESSKEVFCEQLSQNIRRYEPRFKEVHVSLQDNDAQQHERTLRLRIEGLLYAEPNPEPIVLDSVLEPEAREFSLSLLSKTL